MVSDTQLWVCSSPRFYTVASFACLSQVALVDVLRKMGIEPDGIVGHSVGELGCAYADGSLSGEEAVLAAYWRGHCIQQAQLPPGGMAAVGEMSFHIGVLFRTLKELSFISLCPYLSQGKVYTC